MNPPERARVFSSEFTVSERAVLRKHHLLDAVQRIELERQQLLDALDAAEARVAQLEADAEAHVRECPGPTPGAPTPATFEKELASLVNRRSLENDSNTPDFILSQYLIPRFRPRLLRGQPMTDHTRHCPSWCERCWRCGEPSHGLWPYYLCQPCVDVVSPEEIAWMNEPTREPQHCTWEMTPLGRPQGIA